MVLNMTKEIEKIFCTDDKAAKPTIISGWLSSTDRFFTDENIARYDGSTHVVCDKCGGDCKKPYFVCESCRNKSDDEKYLKKEFKEWDGETPLVIFGTDNYFFDYNALICHCEDNGLEIENLQLIICEPVHLPELDYRDFFHDELPEDGDLKHEAPEVVEAFEVLNQVIRKQKPVSWTEGTFRTTIIEDEKNEQINIRNPKRHF